jgi:hypothetical protein
MKKIKYYGQEHAPWMHEYHHLKCGYCLKHKPYPTRVSSFPIKKGDKLSVTSKNDFAKES